jgi:hypothetical protein
VIIFELARNPERTVALREAASGKGFGHQGVFRAVCDTPTSALSSTASSTSSCSISPSSTCPIRRAEASFASAYEHDHTKRSSASVAAADAFVIVTPEYNYGPPPSLINAFDFVYKEWNYKPAGFVSYGGVSGGLRAVQRSRPSRL